jgi:S-adenosylmethionine/arginine decarboxylase-like enzyme
MNAMTATQSGEAALASAWSHLSDAEIVEHADVTDAWGLALAVDLVGCDPEAIRDGEGIARFAVELCDRIGMRRFGPATVVRFGADPKVSGYSLVQLIETSLVSGHVAETSDSAFLDIFSCRPYPPHAVLAFCTDWFGGRVAHATLTVRGEARPHR